MRTGIDRSLSWMSGAPCSCRDCSHTRGFGGVDGSAFQGPGTTRSCRTRGSAHFLCRPQLGGDGGDRAPQAPRQGCSEYAG